MAASVTAQQVADRIRQRLGGSWKESAIDVFGAGNPEAPVTGIATSFAPSLKVLRAAAAARRNLVIAREHVFYSHGRAAAAQVADWFKDDAAGAAKLEAIARNHMAVWRFAENWDLQKPDRQLRALARALHWERMEKSEGVFELPAGSLADLAARIRGQLQIRGIRVIGAPQTRVARVALTHGLMLVPQLSRTLGETDADAVVIGEPVEWEAAPYFQDVVASGQKKGMIILGQQASEEPGCGEMAAWLRRVVPEVPVEWMAAGEPFRG